jgi:hypothetical protein
MVALHTALAAGWQPPEKMTKAEYTAIKKNPDAYAPELVAFAATGVTFGSMWFGEYVKDGPGENRCRQSRDSCLRDAPGLTGAIFRHWTYDSEDLAAFLAERAPCLIYCDPPYVGTTGYAGAKTKIKVGDSAGKNEWKAAPFWRWADRMVEAGHTVFVSEYTGPKAEVYNVPQTQAEKDVRKMASEFQRDKEYTREGMEEYWAQIREFEEARAAEAQRLADRWAPVWTKEVISDFSASRDKEDSGKKEVETLFHREA